MALKRRKVAPRLDKFQPLTKNSMVLRSTVTRDAVAARFAAKEEGQAAAVRIAKARVAKKKKAPLTKMAETMNATSRQQRTKAKDLTKYLAYEEGYYTKAKQGNKRGNVYLQKRVLAKQAQLEHQGSKTNPIYSKVKGAQEMSRVAAKESKWAARKSGGYATSMKRNAEAGIGHIVRGRALKGIARAGGVLGIASLFAQHIAGGKKEKKNG
jgi:hypothetical protein